MDKQTTIAFVLIGGILVLWLFLNSPEPPKNQPVKKDTVSVNSKTDTLKSIAPPVESSNSAQKDSLSLGSLFVSKPAEEKIITIENNLYLIELSTRGGNIRKVFLKKFNNWYSHDSKDKSNIYNDKVQLINYSKGGTYDLAFVSSEGKAINTSLLNFKTEVDKPRIFIPEKDTFTISFTYELSPGKSIKKIFVFNGNEYGIKSDIELTGMNNLISNNSYDVVWSNGIRFVELNSADESNIANASLFYGDEHVTVDASDEGKKVEKEFNGRVDWIGVRNKYFTSIIAPSDPQSVEGAYVEGTRHHYQEGVREFYNIRLTVPFKNNLSEKRSFLLYMGPVNYDALKTYNHHMEKIVEFGSFFGLKFIVRPIAEYVLLPLFNFLHMFIPNYGFVIIIFALIIKLVLYPLTKSSFQSMKKMQLLAPKINEIKEKYKDDPAKVNKETMGLYKTYGINPAGGCLPLILQMPIFIALWGVLQSAVELRQQPFALWIHDLSYPDYILNLGFKLPLVGIEHISGLAILMGITTFVQQKMTVKDPKQQAMIYMMPIMLTLMFMSFPSGLNLYYFMFNLFSIAQQYYINNKHDDMVLEPVKNPSNKKGFMQKLMDAAEKNAKTQQKRKK